MEAIVPDQCVAPESNEAITLTKSRTKIKLKQEHAEPEQSNKRKIEKVAHNILSCKTQPVINFVR